MKQLPQEALQQQLSSQLEECDFDGCIDTLKKITEITSDNAKKSRNHFTIGVIYRDELGDYDHAIEHFNIALDYNIEELRAFEGIDRLLREIEDWDSLENYYFSMLSRMNGLNSEIIDNMRKQVWQGLGEIYRDMMFRWNDAIDAFRHLSELQPDDAKPHRFLADLYEKTGDISSAIDEMRKYLNAANNTESDSQRAIIYRMLFMHYINSGINDQAVCIAEEMKARGYSDPAVDRFLRRHEQKRHNN